MQTVWRHLFVPAEARREAYGDHALPIGHGQTISQPYIVALMTEALRPAPGLSVLEVGTGCGYQAAVLAACGLRVVTLERIAELAETARHNLAEAGYLEAVDVRTADGSEGTGSAEMFDRIIVTAAAEAVPLALMEQLEEGGCLVAPIGPPHLQQIYRFTHGGNRIEREALEAARFVPLIRDAD